MTENIHIIQKQFVDLVVPRRENSVLLQRQFEKMVGEKLVPMLEPVFDRLAGPDKWVELDKLELNIGYLDLLKPEQWLEKTYHEMAKLVEHAVDKASVHASSNRVTPEKLLIYFLQHGYLPWWSQGRDLEQTVRAVIASAPENLLYYLKEPRARKRWCSQFGTDIQEGLLTALAVAIPFSYADWREMVAGFFYCMVFNSTPPKTNSPGYIGRMFGKPWQRLVL